MKKVILVVMVLVVGLSAEVFSGEKKELSGKLIKVLGYSCDIVDSAVQSPWDGSISVYCNGHQYGYVLRDRGGRWEIEVK